MESQNDIFQSVNRTVEATFRRWAETYTDEFGISGVGVCSNVPDLNLAKLTRFLISELCSGIHRNSALNQQPLVYLLWSKASFRTAVAAANVGQAAAKGHG